MQGGVRLEVAGTGSCWACWAAPCHAAAYPHCPVKVGEAAMKFRGLRLAKLPVPASLNHLLSLEAGRGENQCTEQKFYLQRSSSRPGVVARHEGSVAAVR